MKRNSIIALLLAMVMVMGLFAGCAQEAAPSGDDANKVTVTWYNGSEELKTEKVEKGTKLTSWTPTVEGKEFTGWFSEASLAQEFDFSKEITENTDIFAAFKSNEYVEDSNAYYLIGNGAGSMKESGWDHAKSEANLLMEKQAVEKANVYKITIDMYAGDLFQIAYGGAWDGQQGIGIMTGAEYADGVNAYDNTEYTAADQKYAVVKNEAGEVVFDGSDEYNKGYEVWNIRLANGQDGKYEFTLTTYPANAQYNTLEWNLVEKLEAQEETHKMHLVGTFNEWAPQDENADYHMSKSEDGKTWIGYVEVKADDTYEDNGEVKKGIAFKVVNQINEQWLSPDGNNICMEEPGWYAVRYTVEGNKVEVAKLEYYVVGTFVDAEGNAVNFAVKEGVTPKLENGTVTFEATDVTALSNYSWMKDQGKPGVMAIKVVLGCELGIKVWFADEANGGDNFYVEAGSVTVTFDGTTVTVA